MINYERMCLNCRWFSICPVQINGPICKTWAPRSTKVNYRRLCDFCERHKLIDDEYGNYQISCLKVVPLPAINLTTGEKYEQKRKVEYSMFVHKSNDVRSDVGSFPIKFCPLCGRKLTGEGKK